MHWAYYQFQEEHTKRKKLLLKKANHISIHKLPKAFIIPFPVERQPV